MSGGLAGLTGCAYSALDAADELRTRRKEEPEYPSDEALTAQRHRSRAQHGHQCECLDCTTAEERYVAEEARGEWSDD